MLVHRLRRWPNITSTLGECLLFVGYMKKRRENIRPALGQRVEFRPTNLGPPSAALGQHLTNVGSSGICLLRFICSQDVSSEHLI